MLQHDETINSDRYIQFLEQLIAVRRRGNLIIMHDNARPHVARLTEAFLAEHGIVRIPQPPYSPDMNLLDRLIFRNMEAARRSRNFTDVEDARQFVNNYLGTFKRQSLTNELSRLRVDLQNIIDIGGNYL